MHIIFTRTKNFKKAKAGTTFHKVIENAIKTLKPDGNGPIKERITVAPCFIRIMTGTTFYWTLNLNVTDLELPMRSLLFGLRRQIQKDFQRWGKYKVQLQSMTALRELKK